MGRLSVRAIWEVGKKVVGAVLILIGLADGPEAFAKYSQSLYDLWMWPNIDWVTFFQGDGGRWFFIVLGAVVTLWAWDVPQRLIAKSQGKPFGGPVGISGQVTWKRIAADSSEGKSIKISMLMAEIEKRDKELEILSLSFQQMTSARDAAVQAYDRCRHNFAMERFQTFTRDYPGVTVTIRTAGYNDWALVQQVKTLFEKNAQWSVEIDPNNSPPLLPNAHFKVLLLTGDTDRLHRLHALLDVEDGGLLPVRVGIQHNNLVDFNNKRLTIEILPIVTD